MPVAIQKDQSISTAQAKMFSFKVVVFVVALFQIACAFPSAYQDLETAASEHDYGRVQIKVFRGPTEHNGHDHFAPWGYWVKQPADEHHH